jgi:hypothetical protein
MTFLKGHKFYWDVLDDRNLPYQSNLDLSPKLKKSKVKHFDTVLRYIMFLYDKDTPFTKKFPNFEERKRQAIIEACWGEVPGTVLDTIMNNKDEAVVDMIVEFLRIQDDKLWSTIITHEELFLEYTRTLFKPIEMFSSDKDLIMATTTKEKIREAQGKVRVELKALYDEFYKGDVKLEEAVRGKKFSPEYMAKKVG